MLPEDAARVAAHEIAHGIDYLVREIPTEGIMKELRYVYNGLNNSDLITARRYEPNVDPQSRSNLRNFGPESNGYRGSAVRDELIAEAIRAYAADPNYLKTVAPEAAARIREYVNSHPWVSKIIQFNVIPLAAGAAAAGAGGSDVKAAFVPVVTPSPEMRRSDMLLNAKQHFTLAHYVRMNQQQQRNAGRTIADPAWQMKRAQSFLTLAKMTAKRAAGAASRMHKPRMPHGAAPAHGVRKSLFAPQQGPSNILTPNSTQPEAVRVNAPPPAITGTPEQLGAGMLQMQGAIPGLHLPGAPGAAAPNLDLVRPHLPAMPSLPRVR